MSGIWWIALMVSYLSPIAVLILLASPSVAESPILRVSITDGDPYDRIRLINLGDCASLTGLVTIDFANSVGKIVIDTQYGGVGTKDPMPVAVEAGPIAVKPVFDGDTQIGIFIDGMVSNGQGAVTLDVDNDASGWFARRVSILSDDLAGTVVRFGADQTVFGATSTVDLVLDGDACAQLTPEEIAIPTS